MLDPDFVKKEKDRHREKYYRLGYKEKHKPTTEKKAHNNRLKYPEKSKAKKLSKWFERIGVIIYNHWNYKHSICKRCYQD
jgi:hypothetical protein